MTYRAEDLPRPRERLRQLLAESNRFLIAAEIETTRGMIMEARSAETLGISRRLAETAIVDLLCITDNPGGQPHIRPEVLGYELLARGQEVVINLSCKDYNRNGIESRLWALASMGFENVLALTGDYPVSGHSGQARPVFDVDSVALLEMMRRMNDGLPIESPGRPGHRVTLQRTCFFPGAAVNPFKRHEGEVIPQYLKLAYKLRSGAQWVIAQIGFNARRHDELLRYMRFHRLDVPVIGAVFTLSGSSARHLAQRGVPGVIVCPELLSLAEKRARSPDRGKKYFEELTAKQIAILRGLGYRGVYLSGRLRVERIESILDIEKSFGPGDWKEFAKEIQFGYPGEFYFFERDPATHLNTGEVDRTYLASRGRARRPPSRLGLPITYRLGKLAHGAMFEPGSPGARVGGAIYRRATGGSPLRALHLLEQSVKVPLYGCRDCGDCSLPEIAYLCPESQCVKNQRNGPCGGTHDGYCEVLDKECIWSRAYKRLKAEGQELSMLDRPVVFTNGALRGTSAWANTFLGRDHHAPGLGAISPRRTAP